MVRYITFYVAQSMKDVVESWIVRLKCTKLHQPLCQTLGTNTGFFIRFVLITCPAFAVFVQDSVRLQS